MERGRDTNSGKEKGMIKNIRVRTVSNSKGAESVKVELTADKGSYSASVPSGTSTGIHEAVELPAKKILENLDRVKPKLVGLKEDYKLVDKVLKEIDKSGNFSKIGSNLALGISIAAARAETNNNLAKLGKLRSFPLPVSNMIGGGRHGGETDWQEFLLMPKKAKTTREAFETVRELHKEIGVLLKKNKMLAGKNLEGAWKARLDDLKTLDLVSDVAEDFGAKVGLDIAASSFWDGKRYVWMGKELTREQQIDFLANLVKQYRISYLEDPFQEEDFESFSELTKAVGKRCLVVGDDLYCTNPARLETGLKKKATNGIVIKPNQIGTLTDSFRVVEAAKNNGLEIVPSHRSGETKDDWLADLAAVWGAKFIKIGLSEWDRPKFDRLVKLFS